LGIFSNFSNTIVEMVYDICIIGAGIAGLYCALELSKKYPTKKICILEKSQFIGGRTATFRQTLPGIGRIQWEEGAGRVHNSHHHVIKLLEKYGLTRIPISGDMEWRKRPFVHELIEFSSIVNSVPFDQLDEKALRTHTLKYIMESVMGTNLANELMDRYEYRSELDTQRADKGLEALKHELGVHEGFFVIKEGFSKLIGLIKADIEKAGVKILREYDVHQIQPTTNNYSVLINGKSPIKAIKLIVALTRDAVAKIPCFSEMPILTQVKMRPLVRIYAVFPLKNGVAWFHGVNKFVCPKPVRYVIPMNPKMGTIMISYTDGEDAEYWMNLISKSGEDEAMRQIMEQIRMLFPNKQIPDPTFQKVFSWLEGCSYWTPGDYDFNKVSKKSVRPLKSMPGVYMCGESWAYNQAWVQCAIDQADHALAAFDYDLAKEPVAKEPVANEPVAKEPVARAPVANAST